jgi:hypothetical protein
VIYFLVGGILHPIQKCCELVQTRKNMNTGHSSKMSIVAHLQRSFLPSQPTDRYVLIFFPMGSYPLHKDHAVHKCKKLNMVFRLPDDHHKYSQICICATADGRPNFVLCSCGRTIPFFRNPFPSLRACSVTPIQRGIGEV